MSNVYRSYQGSAGVQPTGNATVSDVLEGKTFSNASGVGLEGTMPDIGAVVETIEPGETYTIPEGYHDGSGSVSANVNDNPVLNMKPNTYFLVADRTIQAGAIPSSGVISQTATAAICVLIEVSGYSTLATAGKPVSNYVGSADGVTWTQLVAGDNNISSYKYVSGAIGYPGSVAYSFTLS